MTDQAQPPRDRLAPWDFHPALTEERISLAARLLSRGRADALARAEPGAGDDSWSVGCRAYAFSRHQVRQAAASGQYPWLRVLDDTHHFVFLIDGIPVRFYRGDAGEPSRRTLRQQQEEAEQLSLALGRESHAQALMFRLAVETGRDGEVKRIVFLALEGEEGRVACFWPVPPQTMSRAPSREARSHSGPSGPIQLALLPGTLPNPGPRASRPRPARHGLPPADVLHR